MKDELTRDDLDLIIDSLDKSKQAVTASDKHPDYAFKRKQIESYDNITAKMRAIRDRLPRS